MGRRGYPPARSSFNKAWTAISQPGRIGEGMREEEDKDEAEREYL